jgi:hypothetical protein
MFVVWPLNAPASTPKRRERHMSTEREREIRSLCDSII